jgi:truncated hemoglobin YjbI
MDLKEGGFDAQLRLSLEKIQSEVLNPESLKRIFSNDLDTENEHARSYIFQVFNGNKARIFNDPGLNQKLFSALKNTQPLGNWLEDCYKTIDSSPESTGDNFYSPSMDLMKTYLYKVAVILFKNRFELKECINTNFDRNGLATYESEDLTATFLSL